MGRFEPGQGVVRPGFSPPSKEEGCRKACTDLEKILPWSTLEEWAWGRHSSEVVQFGRRKGGSAGGGDAACNWMNCARALRGVGKTEEHTLAIVSEPEDRKRPKERGHGKSGNTQRIKLHT